MISNSKSESSSSSSPKLKVKSYLWILDFLVLTSLLSILITAGTLMKSDAGGAGSANSKALVR